VIGCTVVDSTARSAAPAQFTRLTSGSGRLERWARGLCRAHKFHKLLGSRGDTTEHRHLWELLEHQSIHYFEYSVPDMRTGISKSDSFPRKQRASAPKRRVLVTVFAIHFFLVAGSWSFTGLAITKKRVPFPLHLLLLQEIISLSSSGTRQPTSPSL
jgi:hypothetical protein